MIIDDLRRAYSRLDFWSKSARRACRKPLFLRRKLNWRLAVQKFLDECDDVENNYGPVLELSDESIHGFLGRLVCRLKRMGRLDEPEATSVLDSLERDSAIPDVQDEVSSALILKACLEYGRLRPAAPYYHSVAVLMGGLPTVDDIVNLNVDTPLTIGVGFRASLVSPLEYSRICASARSRPEFHFVVAKDHTDFEYGHAVGLIGRDFDSLDVAYREISGRGPKTSAESMFISKFNAMSKLIS
jgi:hypothetical protein